MEGEEEIIRRKEKRFKSPVQNSKTAAKINTYNTQTNKNKCEFQNVGSEEGIRKRELNKEERREKEQHLKKKVRLKTKTKSKETIF